jgi:hypothetical protein
VFAAELQAARRDSMISPADIDLLEELQVIAASTEASLCGRSLSIVVGSTPLLHGAISDGDRRDIELVRDFLLPKKGNLSGREFAAFLRSNPRIGETYRAYGSAVEQAVARRRQPWSVPPS